MYENLRPILFRLDPEQAHNLILGLIRIGGYLPPIRKILRGLYSPQKSKPVTFGGLKFPNLVGLAAGYDKNGSAWRGLSCLGFGHLELGTVTPQPQIGNPKPRIFRFPDQEAIINRMGFPGKGAKFAAKMMPLPKSSPERDQIILGMNIGKNGDTPNQTAAQDYLTCMRLLHKKVDYFAINVSSPNTIGLRKLQGKKFLNNLLHEIINERDLLKRDEDKSLPIFVKLSPDLDDQELDDALEAIISNGADGVIATNTTIQRAGLLTFDPDIQGGLSGKPINDLSTDMIRKIHRRTGGKLPIIGVGGISSVDGAREKLDAGAGLIQVYSGLIFRGPGLVRELAENL
jgi:dihydroorotate dehydrogenase